MSRFVLRMVLWLALAVPLVTVAATVNVIKGWNLLGNSEPFALDVASGLGDQNTVATVWKWNRSAGTWALYAPSMTPVALAAYAKSKGYDVLTSIASKEGYWVNAVKAATLTVSLEAPSQVGTPPLVWAESDLGVGWNLLATADGKTPSQFNAALAPNLNAAGKSIQTLWAWDAAGALWKFYAPALAAQGDTALSDYIANQNYLPFASPLSPTEGFWVNVGDVNNDPPISTTTVGGQLKKIASVQATKDTTKPKVTRMSVDKSSILLGEKIKVSCDVSDNAGLLRVELWHIEPNGQWHDTGARKNVSGKSASVSFDHTPTKSGINKYGIHVVDQAGNWDSEGSSGPKSVNVIEDKEKPILKSFSVTNEKSGGATVNYDVKDAGGSHLKQVELWKGLSKDNLSRVTSQTRTMSDGNDSAQGTFTDKPNAAGTFYYGIHAVDNAGNVGYDSGAKSLFVYYTPDYVANYNKRGYCYPQCVEFVRTNLGLPAGRLYAKDYWTYKHANYNNYAQGNSTRAPRPGDILVWSGKLNPNFPVGVCPDTGCGHVAIVKSVNLNTGVLIRVDANWKGKCAVIETEMTVTKNSNDQYTIGGADSSYLLGWQSKD